MVNFLLDEKLTLYKTLINVAIKIRDKIIESGVPILCTENSFKDTDRMKDTLYGYVYSHYDYDTAVSEMEVKGFCVQNSTLFICIDVPSVVYTKEALIETFNKDTEEWHAIIDWNNNLVISDTCNVFLTLLSIVEDVYQYF